MIIPELVDGCNVKCELCWNRHRQPSMDQMSLSIVEQVLNKYKNNKIEWYNWGEPLLHNDFIAISEMCKNTNSRISSSLSLLIDKGKMTAIKNFKSIIVSLSGMDKKTYNVYHRKGNYDLVIHNLNKLIKQKTNITIRWLSHKYNLHQYKIARAFCHSNGMRFESVGLNCMVEEALVEFKHELLKTTKSQANKCKQLKWVPISVDGEYLLCCASQNVEIGYKLSDNITPKELIQIKKQMPLCKKCHEKEIWKLF